MHTGQARSTVAQLSLGVEDLPKRTAGLCPHQARDSRWDDMIVWYLAASPPVRRDPGDDP